MHTNLILATDSYKVSHYRQYPQGTTHVYSFFESRGGKFKTVTPFGLQYILRKYLAGPVVTEEDIEEAKEYFSEHFGDSSLFNESGWRRIVDVHKGRLPLLIKAVPEGLTVPTSNVLMTVENTDPELAFLTNYFETILSQAWYPFTVATQSREMRKLILEYLRETGDEALIDFKLHDFGYRGSTSIESAGIGGAAHLISFKGTDTMAALEVARKYYGERMAGFSIPAAEHSTVTSWGREYEMKACENMLDQFPSGLVAVVSDSYDVFQACREIWGKQLREKVLAREGTLVVRPDSGHPPDVDLEVLNILGEAFGFSVNAKGYKVLNPKVRVIQGDGIDFEMIKLILENLKKHGWSADNIAFGSGGGLLQKVNRDTLKFAFKCSAVRVNGDWRDVYKDPVTDHGKRSKAGRLQLVRVDDSFATVPYEDGNEDILVPVFLNGEMLRNYSFEEIRNRANQ